MCIRDRSGSAAPAGRRVVGKKQEVQEAAVFAAARRAATSPAGAVVPTVEDFEAALHFEELLQSIYGDLHEEALRAKYDELYAAINASADSNAGATAKTWYEAMDAVARSDRASCGALAHATPATTAAPTPAGESRETHQPDDPPGRCAVSYTHLTLPTTPYV